MHTYGATQPVFQQGNGQDRVQDCSCCIYRGNEDPYHSDSDPVYHFSHFVQDWLEARLADVRAASAVEDCDPLLSPCMMPYLPDIFRF